MTTPEAPKLLPLYLDTDIGDDIDDALALSLLLASPEYELRGVTTVFRDAPRRALLAREVLRSSGREDVPVAAGISKPLLEPASTQTGAQMQVLGGEAWPVEAPHAVDFLVEQASRFEGTGAPSFAIAAIGPLTNIAAAIVREPSLVQKARLVIMGGFLACEYAEWNIACDPEAAAIVFSSGIEIDMVGLDVTKKCQLNAAQVERVERSYPLLGRLMRLWLGEANSLITLHDPLAVMTMVSDVVAFEPRRIEIGLHGEERGHTLVRDGAPNVRAAVSVDAPRAVEEFLNRLDRAKDGASK